MPSSATIALKELLVQGTHRFASCWKIERADAVKFYFTDHDSNLVFGGNTYVTTGAVAVSARQRKEGLVPTNAQIRGALKAAAITDDDLRAGKYREAKITEYFVDWRYPWKGAIYTNVFFVQEVMYDGEVWQASCAGKKILLTQSIGSLYTKGCRWIFGDSDCAFDIDLLRLNNRIVSSIVDQRKTFRTSITGKADDYYNDGYIQWKSGTNNGIIAEIKDYISLNGEIELYVDLPFDIASATTFDIWPGCDKTEATCKNAYSNFANFGGFPHIPGTDEQLETP